MPISGRNDFKPKPLMRMLRRENGRGGGDSKQEDSAMTVDNDAGAGVPMPMGMARYVSGRDGAFDNSTIDNSDSHASRRSDK
jgi:hypothetical protein